MCEKKKPKYVTLESSGWRGGKDRGEEMGLEAERAGNGERERERVRGTVGD